MSEFIKKIQKINSILEVTMLRLSIILLQNKNSTLYEMGEQLVKDHCDEIASGGYWIWNHVTNEVYYSPKFCKTLGYEYGELGTGFGGFNRGNAEQMAKGMAMIQALIDSKSNDTFINHIVFTKKDGTTILIECSGTVIFICNVPFIVLGTHKI